MDRLFNNTWLSDITLQLSEETSIPAHKAILVSKCRGFYDLIKNNTDYSDTSHKINFSMDGHTESALLAVVKHIYGIDYDVKQGFVLGGESDGIYDDAHVVLADNLARDDFRMESTLHHHVNNFKAAEWIGLDTLTYKITCCAWAIFIMNVDKSGFFADLDMLFSTRFQNNDFADAILDHCVKNANLFIGQPDFSKAVGTASPFLSRMLVALAKDHARAF